MLCNMKHEIIELHDVQIIGMAKKIAFNEARSKYRGSGAGEKQKARM